MGVILKKLGKWFERFLMRISAVLETFCVIECLKKSIKKFVELVLDGSIGKKIRETFLMIFGNDDDSSKLKSCKN